MQHSMETYFFHKQVNLQECNLTPHAIRYMFWSFDFLEPVDCMFTCSFVIEIFEVKLKIYNKNLFTYSGLRLGCDGHLKTIQSSLSSCP